MGILALAAGFTYIRYSIYNVTLFATGLLLISMGLAVRPGSLLAMT